MASQLSPPPPPTPPVAGSQKHLLHDPQLPFAKRPRLSPTPGQHAHSFPTSPFSNSPFAGSPTPPSLSLPGHAPTYGFNTPQPVQPPVPAQQPQHQPHEVKFAPGVMGPPERPAARIKEEQDSKSVDPNTLSDIVTASGIDLRQEEDYLAMTYRNRMNEGTISTSFGALSGSTASPHTSFNQWSQGSYDSHGAFSGSGPLSQPAVSQRSLEEQVEEKARKQAASYAEMKSRPLIAPFANLGMIRWQLQKKTHANQVRWLADGRAMVSDPPKYYGTAMPSNDGVGVMQAKGTGVVYTGSPLEEMLAILGLATQERVRTVLEDAVMAARSRRVGADGIVPPEWASVATGSATGEETTAKPEPVTGTSWDRPSESAKTPAAVATEVKPVAPRLPDMDIKAEDGKADVTAPPSTEPAPQPTRFFKPEIPPLLKQLGAADRKAEEARLAARKKRQSAEKDKEASGTDSALALIGATAANGTSVGTDSPAGTVDSGPATPSGTEGAKISKKEREKAAKATAQTEAVLSHQANQTAAMALGGFGKKYSWMMGGSSSGAAKGGFGTGVGAGRGVGSRTTSSTTGPGSTSSGAGAGRTTNGSTTGVKVEEDRNLRSKETYKLYGDFKENGPKGRKVQIRDVVTALEGQGGRGVEARALHKAFIRMGAEKDVS